MKYILFFSTFLIFSFTAFGQNKPRVGSSKSAAKSTVENTVVLTTKDTPAEAIKKIRTILKVRGHEQDSQKRTALQPFKPEPYSVKTKSKMLNKIFMKTDIVALKIDGETRVIIKGTVKYPELEIPWREITFGPIKTSPLMDAWWELKAIADAYQTGEITYAYY